MSWRERGKGTGERERGFTYPFRSRGERPRGINIGITILFLFFRRKRKDITEERNVRQGETNESGEGGRERGRGGVGEEKVKVDRKY